MDTMMRTLLLTTIGLASLGALGAPVQAQPPGMGFGGQYGGFGGQFGGFGGGPVGPRSGSGVNPILNLTRQGTSPAVNYYGLVRPQTQFSNAIQDLQRQSMLGPYSGMGDYSSELPSATGHQFGFLNQSIFFQNQYLVGSFGLNRGYGYGSAGGFGAGNRLGGGGFGGAGGMNQGFGGVGGAPSVPRR